MKRTGSGHTERVGVAKVQLAIEGELGWIFREQFTSDVGIDAQVELVIDGVVSGRLLALQIKAGPSYFEEHNADHIVYRGDAAHRRYWLDHVLPVVVVLVDEAGTCYWQAVTPATVESTGKGWKMLVPRKQVLDSASGTALTSVATAGASYQQRLTRLVLDLPLMTRLAAGDELRLEVSEWVNKSSGRGKYRILSVDGSDEEKVLQEFEFIAPGWDYETMVHHLFPWSDARVDQLFYDAYDEDRHAEECGVWDQEEGRYMMHIESYGEWIDQQPPFRPYATTAGEVAEYRFELALNELGEAFLKVHGHLAGG